MVIFHFVSNTYGGRASDIFIVEDSRFCNRLQPQDQVMADCGLPFSSGHQGNVEICRCQHQKETSLIANVRIYVEQAIKRVIDFDILKKELPISLLPLLDDIVVVCCALCNVKKPLSQDIQQNI